MRSHVALLAVDAGGRCLVESRAGEGVHGGEWIELPEAPVRGAPHETLEELARTHLGEAARAPSSCVGTFVGRGDVLDLTVEVRSVGVVEPRAVRGRFVTEGSLAEAARRGEALLSPALAAYLSRGEGGAFRRETWEVAKGVHVYPLRTPTLLPATHTNAFLFAAARGLVIEPASPDPDEIERFACAIEAERARSGFTLEAALVTHHHPDHVGGVRLLRERLGVPVLAHHETIERLEGSVDFDGVIEDGQRFDLGHGLVVEAVHTPGHAPGHLVFFDRRSRALVAGDMVAGVGTILVEKTDGDMGLYLDSLERMKALDPSMLLPAHGGVILAPRARLDFYREHRLMREAKVLDALGACSPATVDELVPRAYDDAPRAVWPLAAMSLEAHLLKLEGEGRAAREGEIWRVTEG